MKNIIFCYSGTGNSLATAMKIKEQLDEAVIISMDKNYEEAIPVKVERIGFVFPVHHWNMPKSCTKICPAKNIEIVNGKIEFKHKCQQCMSCIQYCQSNAINYKNITVKRQRYHHPDVGAREIMEFRK